MTDLKSLSGRAHILLDNPRGALAEARKARRDAELAGDEMEKLAAVLHRKPPVGRWPLLARASFGPRVALFSG
jgi:hypothetical protein